MTRWRTRHLLADTFTDRRYNAARLMSADDRVGVDRQPTNRLAARLRPAVLMQKRQRYRPALRSC